MMMMMIDDGVLVYDGSIEEAVDGRRLALYEECAAVVKARLNVRVR